MELVTGFRFQVSGFRFQVSGFRLRCEVAVNDIVSVVTMVTVVPVVAKKTLDSRHLTLDVGLSTFRLFDFCLLTCYCC